MDEYDDTDYLSGEAIEKLKDAAVAKCIPLHDYILLLLIDRLRELQNMFTLFPYT